VTQQSASVVHSFTKQQLAETDGDVVMVVIVPVVVAVVIVVVVVVVAVVGVVVVEEFKLRSVIPYPLTHF
jgi:hypothetical protein